MNRKLALRSTTAVLGVALASFSLGACNNPATAPAANGVTPPAGALPLADATPPAPAAAAPDAAQLPAAPPAPVARAAPPRERYRYVDEAASMSRAFANTPPDYAVDYGGTRPWIWRAQNGAYRVVERVPGGERYYYYQPGAQQPFLVRDPRYTYAYDQGRLAVVYDAGGRPLPADSEARQADIAGRYLFRAQALHDAALHQQHEAAYAANWQARRAELAAQQQQWERAQQQTPEWNAWHAQNPGPDQTALNAEQARRQAYAAQVAAALAVGRAQGAAGQRAADQAQAAARAQQAAAQAQAVAAGRGEQARIDAAKQAQAAATAKAVSDAEHRQAKIDAAQQAAKQAADAKAAAAAKQRAAQAEAAKQAKIQAAEAAKLKRARDQQAAAKGAPPPRK